MVDENLLWMACIDGWFHANLISIILVDGWFTKNLIWIALVNDLITETDLDRVGRWLVR